MERLHFDLVQQNHYTEHFRRQTSVGPVELLHQATSAGGKRISHSIQNEKSKQQTLHKVTSFQQFR
jgi:hypothetical protein